MYKVCRHIRTSGGRCRAAALHNENFCYYHLSQRRHSITLQLPPLEDRSSIQIAVSRVLASLAAGLIDRRDAGMYLYGIQIAATNLRGSINEIEPEEDTRRLVLTRNHDEIAESETILEEDDDNFRHKDDCTCDACNSTETDTPHHPNCHCTQCHLFAEEQQTTSDEPSAQEPITIQAKADDSLISPPQCHPERSDRRERSRRTCPERSRSVRIVALRSKAANPSLVAYTQAKEKVNFHQNPDVFASAWLKGITMDHCMLP